MQWLWAVRKPGVSTSPRETGASLLYLRSFHSTASCPPTCQGTPGATRGASMVRNYRPTAAERVRELMTTLTISDGLMIAGAFGGVVGGPMIDGAHATPCKSALGDVLNSAGSESGARLTKRRRWEALNGNGTRFGRRDKAKKWSIISPFGGIHGCKADFAEPMPAAGPRAYSRVTHTGWARCNRMRACQELMAQPVSALQPGRISGEGSSK